MDPVADGCPRGLDPTHVDSAPEPVVSIVFVTRIAVGGSGRFEVGQFNARLRIGDFHIASRADKCIGAGVESFALDLQGTDPAEAIVGFAIGSVGVVENASIGIGHRCSAGGVGAASVFVRVFHRRCRYVDRAAVFLYVFDDLTKIVMNHLDLVYYDSHSHGSVIIAGHQYS